jgi:hypothetical protein
VVLTHVFLDHVDQFVLRFGFHPMAQRARPSSSHLLHLRRPFDQSFSSPGKRREATTTTNREPLRLHYAPSLRSPA